MNSITTRMWANFEDPRIGYEGKSIISEYDYPHTLTLIFGKRFKNLRSTLDDSNFLLKYMTYILPFSDDMEISFRWRYASGRPYTQQYWTTTAQYYEDNSHWSRGSWQSSSEANTMRYPDYHRLDIAFNSRYNFEKWSLEIYLSIQNLYNRQNIAGYQYNDDGTIENIYQYSFLPVVGIDLRF